MNEQIILINLHDVSQLLFSILFTFFSISLKSFLNFPYIRNYDVLISSYFFFHFLIR